MSTPEQQQQEEARKTENEWRGMRRKTMGELLRDRFGTGNDYTKFLIDMELDRRKFVRDVMIDRWLAAGAIIVSLASLVVSVIAISQ